MNTSLRTLHGWVPDPKELPEGYGRRPFADHINTFSARAASPTGDYDIPHTHPVYNQGRWGACVAHAVTGAMNVVLEVEHQRTAPLSRFFLYQLCREVMGTKDEDSGTQSYIAVDRVGKVGICEERFFPYVDENMFAGIPPECYPEASDNKASAWFNLQGTGADRLEQLDVAVRSNHPIIFGTRVDSGIRSYTKGQILDVPTGAFIGGHEMVVVGIRYVNGKRCWRIRNSWGAEYGDDGHLLITDAFMGWSRLVDLWLMTRMDPLLF